MKVKQKSALVLIISVIISGCCREPVEIERYELSEEGKNIVPYVTGQKIEFIHSNGYTFQFLVTSRESVLNQEPIIYTFGFCDKNFITREINTTHIVSSYPSFDISFELSTGEYYDLYYENSLHIKINQRYSLTIRYDSVPQSIQDTNIVFYDTLFLNDKQYYNVVEKNIEWFGFSDTSSVFPRSILYNQTDGLLQIKISNNENYSIK